MSSLNIKNNSIPELFTKQRSDLFSGAVSKISNYECLKAQGQNTPSNQDAASVVALDSLDIKEEAIEELFKKCVEENSSNATASTSGDQKKILRAMRKAQKSECKKKASQKTKAIYDIVIPETQQLKGKEILELRFSQDSIDAKTNDGAMTLEELSHDMTKNGWKSGTQITVIKMPDGHYLSADNRRLFAAKKVAAVNDQFTITINLFDHADKAPKNFIRGIEAEFRKGREIQKAVVVSKLTLPGLIKPDTYGYAMLLRINTRSGDLSQSHFGYIQEPFVR